MLTADNSQVLLEGFIAVQYLYTDPVAIQNKTMSIIPKEYSVTISHNNSGQPVIITFGVPKTSRSGLNLYNVSGKKICTLANKVFSAGYHSIKLQDRHSDVNLIPAGVYLVSIETKGKRLTKKFILHR
jgi:hypothetical protein